MTQFYPVFSHSLLLAVTVSTVFAASPLNVHIEVAELIGGLGVNEPFTASGAAVDNGVICASGMVQDVSVSTSGAPSAPYRNIQVLKRFTCGTDTFDVRMVVKLDLATNFTTASWSIVGGTGVYADLRGRGSLVGTPIDPGSSIFDVYDGSVH